MIRLRHSEQRCAVRAASESGSFIFRSVAQRFRQLLWLDDTGVRTPCTYGEKDVIFNGVADHLYEGKKFYSLFEIMEVWI